MLTWDPTASYRDYLRHFGVEDAGERVAAPTELDLPLVRFFAYAGSNGLRFKAAVTAHGLVTPGGNGGDDWYGFLTAVPDALSAAERIAWLETDASAPPHGLPRPPALALVPDQQPAVGIDPAQWELVTPPALTQTVDGSVTLTAWILPAGSRIPVSWTVIARRAAPAVIERATASDLLATNSGGADVVRAAAIARARRVLIDGTDDERWWALQHIGDAGDRAAVPDIAAVLLNPNASATVRLTAAGTLARLSAPMAMTPLVTALRADTAPEVRRACAQALGRIADAGVVRALTAVVSDEPDVGVRAEIVQALIAQGGAARAVLKGIAQRDPDPAIRQLAGDIIDDMSRPE